MKLMRLPGIVAYAAMAMWLLQIAITPAGATEPAASRAADHLEEIRAALVGEGAPSAAEIELAAPGALIALSADEALAIDSVSYNAATGRFLMRARGADIATPIVIAGFAAVKALVPAPVRFIARNETIAESDLQWIEMRAQEAAPFIEDADLVVGKIARRPLNPGAPFRKADLVSPTLIKRGASATIVLEGPGIRLTQIAVALDNGAEGDLIAFRNVNSGREFKAIVAALNVARAPFARETAIATLANGR